MIPLKNFDDKRFLQLLEEARGLIHRYSDEWTDENYHDPGITFLEMLTWLTEMQRFYLSRISDVSMSQLIELMGYLPKGSRPASGIIELTSMGDTVFLPAHSQLKAAEQVFETAEYLDVVEGQIKDIFNFSQGQIIDQTQQNKQQGMHYLPFGKRVEAGELWVLILDKPLPKEKVVQLYIDVYDGYAVKLKDTCRKKHGIKFQMFSSIGEAQSPLILEKDETLGFMRSGLLRFKTPFHHEKEKIGDVEGYPIVIRINEDYDLLSPQFNHVFMNAARCHNIDHQVQTIWLTEGEHILQFELAFVGQHMLQEEVKTGWRDLDETQYQLVVNADKVHVKIDKPGRYKMVFWRDNITNERVIGSTSGFPDGMIRFASRNAIVDALKIECSHDVNNYLNWQSYDYTDSFLKHDNESKVFTIDKEHEFIYFGNHEHGYLPEKGDQNVRLVSLQLSNFERGNIKAGRLQGFARDFLNNKLHINNPYDFSGGKRRDSKEKILQEVLNTYERKQSLVTGIDYLQAIKAYPDARILYANAYSDQLVENRIKVTGVPYTGERFPKIEKDLKSGLMTYLEKYRMITTAIEFVEPVYMEVSVYVDLIVDQPRLFNSERVEEVLYHHFNPIKGYDVDLEYEMGSLPSKSDVMALLLKLDGVGGIKRLEIEVTGGHMPRHGVIYSDRIQVTYE